MVPSGKVMKRTKIRYNYHDYLLLPEDKRYEILDGELFVVAAPNTRHQRVSRRLAVALTQHTESRDLGEILFAPYDVVLSDENVVQPDIIFVRKERAGVIGESNVAGAPDLAIEILSPATRSKDLAVKAKIYAEFGIQEYWVVDPEADTIEVLTWSETGYVRAGVFAKTDSLRTPALPDLRLSVATVFEP
jgi:Uma2 family endonuclease